MDQEHAVEFQRRSFERGLLTWGTLVTLVMLVGCGRQPVDVGTGPAHPQRDVATAPSPPPVPATPAVVDTNVMVLIAGGTFTMGDPDEVDAPPHPVTVGAFWMDRYLVTQEQYQALMGSNPSRWKGPRNPVEQVRWWDAVKFCNQRSVAEGFRPCYDLQTFQCDFQANGYRLPTDAEWEFACRAGTTTAYFFGDQPARLGDYGWFEQNAGGHPRPVGQKRPNPWGLYDMVGNVWEWCHDYYAVDYYASAPLQDPHGPAAGPNRVLRGGAWRFSADNSRSGYRYSESPGEPDVCFGYDIYGFRCVRSAPAGTGR